MTHAGCHTRFLISNTGSITEPPLNPHPKNPPAGFARASMLPDPKLWDPMSLDPRVMLLASKVPLLLRPMSLALMSRVSRVMLPLDLMLGEPTLLRDLMFLVSRVMLLRPVLVGCVRVRSRCCSSS